MNRHTTLLLIPLFVFCFSQLSAQDYNYVVQIAAFVEEVPINHFDKCEACKGAVMKSDHNRIFRYQVGKFETQEEADELRERIEKQGFPNSIVIDLEEQRLLCSAPCTSADKSFTSKVKENLYLKNIFFDFDKSFLRPASNMELDALIEVLNQNPTYTAEIHGHTDSKGSDSYNLQLSKRRSSAAFSYLTTRGIPPSRINTRMHGEAKPIAKNDYSGIDSPSGRQYNRRVVLVILNGQGEIIQDVVEPINVPAHLRVAEN